MIICFVLFVPHGLQVVFNAYGTKYEFGLFYLLFGRIRLFEIKHIKIKKKKKPISKKVNLGIIKYIRCRIDIGYTIVTSQLSPEYAIANSAVCSLLEYLDSATNIKVVQNICYRNWGAEYNFKIRISVVNIVLAAIKYRIKTGNKILITERKLYGRQQH